MSTLARKEKKDNNKSKKVVWYTQKIFKLTKARFWKQLVLLKKVEQGRHELIQKQQPEVFNIKKVFLEIPQNPQETTRARVSFLL